MNKENPRGGDWSLFYDSVLNLSEAPHMNISRLLRILETDLSHVSKDPASELLDLPRFRLGAQKFRPVAVNGTYQLAVAPVHNESAVAHVIDNVTDETEAVVELGCGYGRNLLAIRDQLEHAFPHIMYYGGDLSESGISTAKKIAGLEAARDNIAFFAFDLLNPDLSIIKEKTNVLFYTVHAIEQAKYLGPSLLEALTGAAHTVTCFHSEPVGWQLNAELMASIADGSFSQTAPNPLKLFGPVDDRYAAHVPVVSGWNRDLIEQLRRFSDAGKIAIEFIEPHAAGNSLYNPSTHILWRKI